MHARPLPLSPATGRPHCCDAGDRQTSAPLLRGTAAAMPAGPGLCQTAAATDLRASAATALHLPAFVQNQLAICLADGLVRTDFLQALQQEFTGMGLHLTRAVLLAHRVVLTMMMGLPLFEIEARLQQLFSATVIDRASDLRLTDAAATMLAERAKRLMHELSPALKALHGEQILDLSPGDPALAGLIRSGLSRRVSRYASAAFPFPEDDKIEPAADTQGLPFEDGRFAAVLMIDGLRHIGHRPQCLRQIARVLQDGGRLLVLEKTAPATASAVDFVRQRRRIFLRDFFSRNLLFLQTSLPLPGNCETNETWQQCFVRNGFQVDECRASGVAEPMGRHTPILFMLSKRGN